MLALYQAADVVLDTYPAGSYLTSLQVTPREKFGYFKTYMQMSSIELFWAAPGQMYAPRTSYKDGPEHTCE